MKLFTIILSLGLYHTLIALYLILLIYTIIRILLDTHSSAKTLAYLLLVFLFPLIGLIFYYAFGINYRHRMITQKGLAEHKITVKEFKEKIPDETARLMNENTAEIGHFSELVKFLHVIGNENLTRNKVKLLINGEEKFPNVLKTLKTATSFIHMEYYAWENDNRGNQIKDVLLQKIMDGVKVRVMYDDYASRKIKHNVVKQLREGGAEIFPVIKVKFTKIANRVNHRDHRKVIIVDGHTGFIGGINISDRYDNSIDTGLWWRDTHFKITGPAVLNLQRHFILNWNACQPNPLSVNKELFPPFKENNTEKFTELNQIIAGGPIYPMSNIMLTYFKIFTLARKKLYITSPYFIPNDSILDALKQAAITGVDVRLLMPKKSDSAVVGAAAKFYYSELLQAGVKIYMYRKGFVHAKTVVADEQLSVVGTANMDIRSFDLNFEIFSTIYGKNFAKQLELSFMNDLKECDELNYEEWVQQGVFKKLGYAAARLISSFL
ncbi:MAG TPA: cardiolipin synthase [Cytophagales bacterium]|jgi:cardiolipin synthase|nr:cardiolipin synthase [Cytophagales bacterium]